MNRSALLAAGGALTAVLAVTLSPLRFRPRLAPPQVERFAAWALVGALAGAAFPKRIGWTTLATVALAVSSEALQLLSPGRHAQVADGVAKCLGGSAGGALVGIAYALKGA